MTERTMGEVEEITGVKAHVIRNWEQEVSMLQRKRDKLGRRIYSERDIQILLRLKHLLYERHFTIAAARHRLFLEFSGPDREIHARIALLRSELLVLYDKVQTMGGEINFSNFSNSSNSVKKQK
jgi:DNA-binding transcriptional MerR regulator